MRRHLATFLGLVLAISACNGPSPEEQRTVERWLLCEECVNGELDSVVAMGERALPILEEALRRGPANDRRDNMRQQIEAMWRGMRDTAVVLFPQYRAHFESNYVASYQTRAAVALDSIGTPQARKILLDALRDDAGYRADVRRTLGRSLGVRLSVVAGDSQHAPLDSFVKVNPEVLIRDSATGSGLEGVRVVFRVDSGNGAVFDPEELTDAAGRAVVRWQLGPEPKDSINILRAVAAGRAVRFHARAHPSQLRVVFVVQPRDGRAGQPFVPPVRIEVHDAWGAIQTQINQTAAVTLVGTRISSAHRVVAGVAQMPGLSVPKPDTNLVLRAQLPGAEPAQSVPFDVVP